MSKTVVSAFSLALLAACGGGGGDSTGSVQGLQAPEQVAIVESSTGSSSLRLPAGLRGITGSDYETDRTRFWVRDDSMQALDTVNMILSSLQQTNYWEQTNAGAYRALVEAEDGGGGGGERGNAGPEYEEWIVESTRANDTAPQIVSFWIEQQESMGQNVPSIIYGKLTVTEEATDGQPLGQFTLYFKNLAASEAATSTDTMFEGYLRTVARTDGQSEVEFYMSHGDVGTSPALGEFAMRERVHVVGNPATDSGRAFAEKSFAQSQGGNVMTEIAEFQLQFDTDYVALREGSNNLSVLDRNDFETRVYRYGVYDATTETRVSQLSGFPVQTADGRNGWAGFHGIWFPEDVTLTNGMTLYRREFGSNAAAPYTLVIAPGKLEKRTRSSITFQDLIDEELEYFSPTAGAELRVAYTGSDFVQLAHRVNGDWQLDQPPVSIASSFTTGQWVNCWSQSRGSVEFAWPSALGDSAPAFVWARETMTADSAELAGGDLTLHGYFHMLRAGITSNQANYQNSESPYLPDATSPSSGNQTYVFDKETLLLTLGNDPVTLGNGVTITQGPGMFGLNCGPLFATALTSFNDIPDQTTTYEWSVGTNSWNQLRTLRDAQGNYVQFDAPLRMTYVHSEVGSAFDGRTFFLEWDGTNLHGIPHQQDGDRWYPQFNIPTGTTLTAGNTSYKVKQLEGEQFMVAVNNPSTVYAAQGFDLDGTPITEPTGAPYTDPAIGPKPTVTAAPLYVGGVAPSSDG